MILPVFVSKYMNISQDSTVIRKTVVQLLLYNNYIYCFGRNRFLTAVMTQSPLCHQYSSSYLVLLCVLCLCFSRALTGRSLMMRAGSANMSVLTEVVFAPVFSTGGGVAFCKNNSKHLIRRLQQKTLCST